MTEKLRDNDREEQAQENGEDRHKKSQLYFLDHCSVFYLLLNYILNFCVILLRHTDEGAARSKYKQLGKQTSGYWACRSRCQQLESLKCKSLNGSNWEDHNHRTCRSKCQQLESVHVRGLNISNLRDQGACTFQQHHEKRQK